MVVHNSMIRNLMISCSVVALLGGAAAFAVPPKEEPQGIPAKPKGGARGSESAADEANAQRLSQAVQKLGLKPNATVAEAGKPLRALLQKENYSPAAVKAVMDGFLGKSRLHSLKLEVLDAVRKTNRTLTVDEARMGLGAAQGMGAYLQATNDPALVEANNRKIQSFQDIIDDADPAKRAQKAEAAKIEELTQAVQKLGLKPNATVAEAGPKLRGFLQSNGYSPAAVKAVMDGFLGASRLFSLKVSLLEKVQENRPLNPLEARLGMEAAQALLKGANTPENKARLDKFQAAAGGKPLAAAKPEVVPAAKPQAPPQMSPEDILRGTLVRFKSEKATQEEIENILVQAFGAYGDPKNPMHAATNLPALRDLLDAVPQKMRNTTSWSYMDKVVRVLQMPAGPARDKEILKGYMPTRNNLPDRNRARAESFQKTMLGIFKGYDTATGQQVNPSQLGVGNAIQGTIRYRADAPQDPNKAIPAVTLTSKDVQNKPSLAKPTVFAFDGRDVLQVVEDLAKEAPGKMAVLNLANAQHRGGGAVNGAMAQEERLFEETTIAPVLMGDGNQHPFAPSLPLYDDQKEFVNGRTNAQNAGHLLYTPGVALIRDPNQPSGANVNDFIEPVFFNMITSAGFNVSGMPDQTTGKIFISREKFNLSIPDQKKIFEDITREKVNLQLRAALANGNKILVLGALGGGVFAQGQEQLVNQTVSNLYKEALLSPEFKDKFEKVVFNVLNMAPKGAPLPPQVTEYQKAAADLQAKSAAPAPLGSKPEEIKAEAPNIAPSKPVEPAAVLSMDDLIAKKDVTGLLARLEAMDPKSGDFKGTLGRMLSMRMTSTQMEKFGALYAKSEVEEAPAAAPSSGSVSGPISEEQVRTEAQHILEMIVEDIRENGFAGGPLVSPDLLKKALAESPAPELLAKSYMNLMFNQLDDFWYADKFSIRMMNELKEGLADIPQLQEAWVGLMKSVSTDRQDILLDMLKKNPKALKALGGALRQSLNETWASGNRDRFFNVLGKLEAAFLLEGDTQNMLMNIAKTTNDLSKDQALSLFKNIFGDKERAGLMSLVLGKSKALADMAEKDPDFALNLVMLKPEAEREQALLKIIAQNDAMAKEVLKYGASIQFLGFSDDVLADLIPHLGNDKKVIENVFFNIADVAKLKTDAQRRLWNGLRVFRMEGNPDPLDVYLESLKPAKVSANDVDSLLLSLKSMDVNNPAFKAGLDELDSAIPVEKPRLEITDQGRGMLEFSDFIKKGDPLPSIESLKSLNPIMANTLKKYGGIQEIFSPEQEKNNLRRQELSDLTNKYAMSRTNAASRAAIDAENAPLRPEGVVPLDPETGRQLGTKGAERTGAAALKSVLPLLPEATIKGQAPKRASLTEEQTANLVVIAQNPLNELQVRMAAARALPEGEARNAAVTAINAKFLPVAGDESRPASERLKALGNMMPSMEKSSIASLMARDRTTALEEELDNFLESNEYKALPSRDKMAKILEFEGKRAYRYNLRDRASALNLINNEDWRNKSVENIRIDAKKLEKVREKVSKNEPVTPEESTLLNVNESIKNLASYLNVGAPPRR